MERIRNFCIIAHIDHGKSTLADRMLEMTGTIQKDKMQAQVMDTMDIERERGITIKLNTARMALKDEKGEDFILNLIDTPGHVDFTYEVSRSLQACEGALLVVDATQGVQAQTVANVMLAMENDLTIIPVLNKVDLPSAAPDDVAEEIEDILGLDCTEALQCSAKTGLGVPEILQAIIERMPHPKAVEEKPSAVEPLRALIYDSFFDTYRGVVVQFRIVQGIMKKGEKIHFCASDKDYSVEEVGYTICGERYPVKQLGPGEVGYVIATVKQVKDARVGDTIVHAAKMKTDVLAEPLPGYSEPKPMIYSGLFPSDTEDFEAMEKAFDKLALNDASLTYERDNAEALGMGFRCGFLGVLHMEVVKERLVREFGIDVIVTAPSVRYKVESKKTGEIKDIRYASSVSEDDIKTVWEPYAKVDLMCPQEYQQACMDLCQNRRGEYKETKFLAKNRINLRYDMPLAEIIRDFFSALKSASKGYASMEYTLDPEPRINDLCLLKISVNNEICSPLTQMVHRSRGTALGQRQVQILLDNVPREQFNIVFRAHVGNRIVHSGKLAALRKDVTAKCYGGDITRKKKLLMAQAKGKAKLKDSSVQLPSDAFIKVITGS